MIKKTFIIFLLFIASSFATSKEEIVEKIKAILANIPDNTVSGIMIYDPLLQDTIFSLNETNSIIPASLTKLFTTATALSLMDSDYKLSTKLYTQDNNLSDGVINGNLFIKGYGNSMFTTENLQNLVNSLKSTGIKKIDGDVIGDDSYFDKIYVRDDWIENEKANVRLPAISALVLDRNVNVVKRKIRKRYRYVTEYVKNPPSFIAQKLKEILKENGIDVSGKSSEGKIVGNAKQIAEEFITLNELIAQINKHSDNFLAECLFKTIGAEESQVEGNSFYSQQAIQKFLKDNNIFSAGTEIVDGSGISRFDHVTPLAVNGLLEKMYFDLNHFDDFFNSLSISGLDGTLRNRMIGSAAEGNFRGKTGSLNGVSGLSGYLTTSNGEDLIITIIFEFNRGGWGFYRDVQDKIVELLADWKYESSD